MITVGCLSHRGLEIRLHLLHEANRILSEVPHLVVSEDAGAADGPQTAPDMAACCAAPGST